MNPLTVADLIRALQKLPPNMEIWIQNVDQASPGTRGNISCDETSGLCVADGKLWLVYDAYMDNAELLNFE